MECLTARCIATVAHINEPKNTFMHDRKVCLYRWIATFDRWRTVGARALLTAHANYLYCPCGHASMYINTTTKYTTSIRCQLRRCLTTRCRSNDKDAPYLRLITSALIRYRAPLSRPKALIRSFRDIALLSSSCHFVLSKFKFILIDLLYLLVVSWIGLSSCEC